MTTLETRGNLPPGVAKPREGYKEMKVCFLSSGTELISKDNFEMSDSDRIAVDHIRGSLKKKRIDDSLNGYLIKENRQLEKEPPEKHINFSKLLDVAIVGCLSAEMLAAAGWIL